MSAAFPWSFLECHFVRVMDAFADGRLTRMQVEDISFTPADEQGAARFWAVANDVDTDVADELLGKWRVYRAENPPPVPDNIVLGET